MRGTVEGGGESQWGSSEVFRLLWGSRGYGRCLWVFELEGEDVAGGGDGTRMRIVSGGMRRGRLRRMSRATTLARWVRRTRWRRMWA